jgi:hypothetical protein
MFSELVPRVKIQTSSAYCIMCVFEFPRYVLQSLIKMVKRRGPKMLPCATPKFTVVVFDLTLLSLTVCGLFSSKEAVRRLLASSKPIASKDFARNDQRNQTLWINPSTDMLHICRALNLGVLTLCLFLPSWHGWSNVFV